MTSIFVARRTRLLASIATFSTLPCVANAAAQSTNPVPQLPPIQVVADDDTSLITPDIDDARQNVRDIAGNASVVAVESPTPGAAVNIQDVLASTPGVWVRGNAGQEAATLSIRGSGLTSALGIRGVRLLRDGLPISRADDVAEVSYADPFSADYIEVYRGGNALQYGAATLGGAINLVSPTGYTRRGTSLRLEGGTNAHLRMQAQTGKVFASGVDAFLSVNRFQTDGTGYRTQHETSRLYGNLGYRFSPASEGRLHFGIERHSQDRQAGQTYAQLREDPGMRPTLVSPTSGRVDIRPRMTLAYQHAWQLNGQDRFSLGVHHTDTRFDTTGTYADLRYHSVDYGLSMRHDMTHILAGRRNRFVWGASYGRGRSHNATYGPIHLNGYPLASDTEQYEDIYGSRSTSEIYAENRYDVTPRITVITGAQAVWASRSNRIDVLRNPPAFPMFQPTDGAAHYSAVNPRVGVLWQAAPQAQVFANITRSYEPPTSLEFDNGVGVLAAQRAGTVEVGSRGRHAGVTWEAAIYHSRVRNELLTVETAPNSGQYISGNMGRTSHAGLELLLQGRWQPGAMPGSVDWTVAYTYSRFRIRDGGSFHGRALPVFAPHVARIDLAYRHPSGMYLGPNLELASSRQVDQANTLKAPGYGVLGFTIGYGDPRDRYTLFLDARNLTDKHYVSSTDYLVNAYGADMPVFHAGLARSVFGGIRLTW